MLHLPAQLVLVQHNGVLGAAAGPVEPYVGLACGSPARLLQHLQRGLIPVQHGFPAQLPVQGVVHWPQTGVRDLQDPVGHGLPGQLQSLPLKLLLQAVQRCVHDEFLRHNVGHRLRGGKAARENIGCLGVFRRLPSPVSVSHCLQA